MSNRSPKSSLVCFFSLVLIVLAQSLQYLVHINLRPLISFWTLVLDPMQVINLLSKDFINLLSEIPVYHLYLTTQTLTVSSIVLKSLFNF